jgi:membrane protease YdiL (CAAX protease family)
MLKSLHYKLFELFILFLIVPISFAIDYPIWIKSFIGVSGLVYIILVLLKIEKYQFKITWNLHWQAFWKRIFIPFMVTVAITIYYVWLTDKSQLFSVLLNNPKLWLFILFFYSLLSVYPQELLYRTFFFIRYQQLFKSKWLFIVFNAALFSLAHVFFENILVIILTFIGGLLFALTYKKTRSTLLVSVEHSLYGCWLFTVGMGNMLGFPS